jgi:hypothetical protein
MISFFFEHLPREIARVVRDTLTGKDEHYDFVRVSTAVALNIAFFLQVWVCTRPASFGPQQTFSIPAFGTGVGLILAAGGAALWMRKDIA